MAPVKINIDKLIRSKRKSIGLEITKEAQLIIRAPKSASLKLIEEIVLKRKNWIEEKQELVRKKYQPLTTKRYVNGEEFLYLGKPYKLNFVYNSDSPIKFDEGFIISSHTENAKNLLIDWYRRQALDIINERVNFFTSLTKLECNKIKISNAQKRWGSCSYTRNLNFNWRLIMAPLEIIDYLVVHELIHLAEPNHSKNFWNKVQDILPQYKEQEKWLKQNGYLLYSWG